MIDLKKSNGDELRDNANMLVKTEYPEYDDFIAEEAIPQRKAQSVREQMPFRPQELQNAPPFKVNTAQPEAYLPAAAQSPYDALTTTDTQLSVTEDMLNMITLYFCKATIHTSKLTIKLAQIALAIAFACFWIHMVFTSLGKVGIAGIILAPTIMLLGKLIDKKVSTKINVESVTMKKISKINPDATAYFENGTQGHFLDTDYATKFRSGETVIAVKLKLSKTQERVENVKRIFIFKL